MFGINLHAGEDGLFGDDDERITKPAVMRLMQKERGCQNGIATRVSKRRPSQTTMRSAKRSAPASSGFTLSR